MNEHLTIKEIGCIYLAMKPFSKESDQTYMWEKFYKLTVGVLKGKYPNQPEVIRYFNSIVEEVYGETDNTVSTQIE
jgi:hypothetical protein